MGQVKVADFGVARLMGVEGEVTGAESSQAASASVSLTEAGKVMGTPQYMAPEQKNNPTEVDHRADIYSLGVVFYQMLTGELPGKRIEAPSKKFHLDVRLDEIVLCALEREPERRYQQASVLKTEVETVATSPLGETTEQTPVEKSGILKLSPFPKLLPGERVVDFRGCIWRLSGKSIPSYRLFFSLPPLWRAALYVTDRRLIVVVNAFWLINQEFSVWLREGAQTRDCEVLKGVSAGKNSFGSYVEVISEAKSKRWYRSIEARARIYTQDSELLLKTVLGAVKGDMSQVPTFARSLHEPLRVSRAALGGYQLLLTLVCLIWGVTVLSAAAEGGGGWHWGALLMAVLLIAPTALFCGLNGLRLLAPARFRFLQRLGLAVTSYVFHSLALALDLSNHVAPHRASHSPDC
jgi:hypothetical protein